MLRKGRGEEGAAVHFDCQGTLKFPTTIHTLNEGVPTRSEQPHRHIGKQQLKLGGALQASVGEVEQGDWKRCETSGVTWALRTLRKYLRKIYLENAPYS